MAEVQLALNKMLNLAENMWKNSGMNNSEDQIRTLGAYFKGGVGWIRICLKIK